MDLEKKYTDSEGEKRNILEMLNCEPEWAANKLQRGCKAIEALKEYQEFNRIRNDLDAYLFELGEWAEDKGEKPNRKDFGV